MNRRSLIKTASAGAAAVMLGGVASAQTALKIQQANAPLKGYVKHSVSYWCFKKYHTLDEFAQICKDIGIQSIELLGPSEWAVVQKYGLTCAMASGVGNIDNGWNDPALHDKLVADYEEAIPQAAKAGLTNLICFSGKRRNLTDEQGWANCLKGLQRIIKTAEKHKVVLTMELLNTNMHKDYQCCTTAWGVELCKRLGSDNFKLLYDIFHMQIMEGNIIDTMTKNIQYISHIHTGGNPGRNEIDETQELNYSAIMKALVNTGYKGFVGQEFIPKGADPIASLRKCIHICDVTP